MPRAPRSKRFRGPRYRPTDFRLGTLEARFEHRHSGPTSGEVVDFSGQGIALAVGAGAGTYLVGDLLPRLQVSRRGEVFYQGSAFVRHVREDEGRTLLGLAFRDAWLDMGKLYHLDLRLDLEQRFGAFFSDLKSLERIDPRFKAWVADVRYFLDELKARLGAEEKRIQDLDQLTREAVVNETVDLVGSVVLRHMEDRIAHLNEIVEGFDDATHQLHRAYLQHHLNPLFLESPIIARSFFKPLGYAGDYEVMNMLYRDHREGSGLFAKVLNVFACNLTAARANINRIEFLADRVAAMLRVRPAAALASVGCGPAADVRALIRSGIDLGDLTVTLLDIEPMAIRYCEKVVLADLREHRSGCQVRFVRESVRDIIRQERLDEVLDPQDIVIAAGLFDYFSDRMFQRLLNRLFSLLRPGGQLLIGNVNTNNDSRYLLEYVGEWFLHHRSPEDLLALTSELPAGTTARVDAEPLGVNLFLHVVKQAEQAGVGEPEASSRSA